MWFVPIARGLVEFVGGEHALPKGMSKKEKKERTK